MGPPSPSRLRCCVACVATGERCGDSSRRLLRGARDAWGALRARGAGRAVSYAERRRATVSDASRRSRTATLTAGLSYRGKLRRPSGRFPRPDLEPGHPARSYRDLDPRDLVPAGPHPRAARRPPRSARFSASPFLIVRVFVRAHVCPRPCVSGCAADVHVPARPSRSFV